jgi:hypothetical protein
MRNEYSAVSAYTLANPNYAPSFKSIPNSDPVEANLEVSTFTEAKAVLDYIKNL